MLKVCAFTQSFDFLDYLDEKYDITIFDDLVDCFIAAAQTNAAMLIQITHPVCKYQDLFATIENYESLPTMLAFYEYSSETIMYSLSNEGSERNVLTALFLETVGKRYPNVLNSWLDKEEINSITEGKACIRSDRLKRDDYLVELFRGINRSEFVQLEKFMNYDLQEEGYYLFSWYIRQNSGLDYLHHTSLKNIYYFVSSLFQMECQNLLSKYYGGEVFFSGTRNLNIIANFPIPLKNASHQKKLEELTNDLMNSLGTKDAHRYRSSYFKSAVHADQAYQEIQHLRSYTFFLRDELLITPSSLKTSFVLSNTQEVTNQLGLIHHMIIYDTGNPQIISHIRNLFLRIIKPSFDYSLYLYCHSVIISTIYQKISGGYHFTPDYHENLTTNLHRSYIEIECNILCKMINELQSDKSNCIPSTKNQLVNSTLEYIQKNYMNDISLMSISENLNVSSVYISQLFKKELGLSPIKYIINYRIDHAKQLLRETDESVYNIAIKSGFWEPKHFSKTFKRITGMTPTQYKHNSEYTLGKFDTQHNEYIPAFPEEEGYS